MNPRAAAALLFVVLIPARSMGAAFYVPDVGVRAIARGGAFVARADDLTAPFYNPAGLALQRGTAFLAEGAWVRRWITFQRTDETGSPGSFDRVDNRSTGLVVPFFAAASDFGLRKWTFALSLSAPYSGVYELPENGPQRYSAISNKPREAYAQLSFGFRAHSRLSLGATLEFSSLRSSNKFAVAVLTGAEGTSDLRVDLTVFEPLSVSGRLGVLAALAPFLDLGVSVKLPLPIDAGGTLDVNQDDIQTLRTTNPNLTDLSVTGSDVNLKFTMPLIVRSGLRFKQRRFDIEVDYVYERWTGFSRLEIVPKDIRYTFAGLSGTLPTIVQDRGFGDSHSVRIGSDIEVIPGTFTARVGYYFESGAVPERSLNVSLVETTKQAFTLGFTWTRGAFAVSAAYAHITNAERQVRNSTHRQTNMTDLAAGTPELSTVVGNGRYASWFNIFSLGIALDIARLAGWSRGDEGRPQEHR